MFFGKGDAGAKKTIAIVDIGSGSVGAALVMLDRNGPPVILAQTRTDVPIDTIRSGQRLADRVLKAAESSLQKIAVADMRRRARAKSATPEAEPLAQVAVFLPAPWSLLFLRNIRMNRNEPMQVNTALIERMVSNYVKGERPDDAVETVIERSAVGIRLNGYPVDDIPNNVTASTVELSIVSVTAPKLFLAALEDRIHDILGHHLLITSHSTSVAAAYALSVIAPEHPDFILCNSEGEVTELLLSLDHTPSGAATSAVGCNAILRTVSVHADMARAEATSALRLARKEKAPMAHKLEKTLAAAGKECSEGFRAAAEELLSSGGVPSVVYIAGNGPEAEWYTDSITRAKYLKKLFPAGVKIESVTYPMLSKYVKDPAVRGARTKAGDAFLALEAIFTDARFDEHRSFEFRKK